MKTRRRLARAALIGAAAAPVVVACAAPGGAPPAADSQRVLRDATLIWMSDMDNQANQDARHQQIAAFRQQHPGVQVERQRVDGYDAKLLAAFAAGTPPDLFAKGATLLRLDPTAARWNEVEQVLNEELEKLWTGAQPARQVAESIKRLADPLLKS